MKYVGTNTLTVLAFHMPIFFVLQHYLKPIMGNTIFYKLVEMIIIWAVVVWLNIILNRYCPLLLGKLNRKQ